MITNSEAIQPKTHAAPGPRFRDEVASLTAPITLQELVWSGTSCSGSIWAIEGANICIAMPLTSPHPDVGTNVAATIRVGGQTVTFPIAVLSASEIHGSTRLITCEMKVDRNHVAPNLQRRANTRFKPGALFPAFCFSYDAINRRALAFSVIDVSNGGVALSTTMNSPLLPGMRLSCRFEVPSIGSFNASLKVRNVASHASGGGTIRYRVSTEFEHLENLGRDILGSCLVRPTAPNHVRELQREKFVPKGWLELIETSSIESINTDADEIMLGVRMKISGRLGKSCVFSCILVLDPSNKASIEDLFVHPDLDQPQLAARLMAEIAKSCVALGIDRDVLLEFGPPWESAQRRSISAKGKWSGRRGAIGNFASAISPRASTQSRKVEWDEYAQAYDTMCSVNLAYQENLARFRDWLGTLRLDANSTVCDVGAGTGNYVLEIVKKFPSTRIIHLDSDPMMNRTASKKYRMAGACNINFSAQSAVNAVIEASSLDLIVCVNALYAFGSAHTVLSNWYSWLKPGGLLFVIDLGRPMDVWDWSRYILGSNIKKQGVKATAAAFLKGRKAIGQNRLIRRQQERGTYWLHSTEAFERTLNDARFEILRVESCYRDVCDLAICSKPSL